jgi:hypothetical protein
MHIAQVNRSPLRVTRHSADLSFMVQLSDISKRRWYEVQGNVFSSGCWYPPGTTVIRTLNCRSKSTCNWTSSSPLKSWYCTFRQLETSGRNVGWEVTVKLADFPSSFRYYLALIISAVCPYNWSFQEGPSGRHLLLDVTFPISAQRTKFKMNWLTWLNQRSYKCRR